MRRRIDAVSDRWSFLVLPASVDLGRRHVWAGRKSAKLMAFPPVPDPPVTADLSALLDKANLALCRLDGALGAHAEAPAFVTMQLRREAVMSCRIENESSTLAAVLDAAVGQDDDEFSASAGAPVRCCQALERGLAEASQEPLNLDSVAAIQAALTGDSQGTGDLAGRTLDEGGAELGTRLADLDEFLTARGELPEIVRIGMAQAQFRRLLPADLGDGRLERIAVLAMFRRLGVPGASALALSPYFQSHRRGYQTHLRGPWAPWLVFFVKAVAESATQAAEMIRRCAILAREHREAICAGLGHAVGRGLQVFGRLTAEPVATVSGVRAITGTSYVAANQLVARFVQMGILEEITGYRRNRRFQYGPYVRIFDPDPTEAPEPPKPGPTSKLPRRRARAMPRRRSPERPTPTPKRRRSPPFSDHLL